MPNHPEVVIGADSAVIALNAADRRVVDLPASGADLAAAVGLAGLVAAASVAHPLRC